MDWKTIQFDWNRAKAFLVTAEERSLSAAARALGTTQPTLGRQVAALESELEVLLFDRIGKQLVLTPSGLELVDHVRQMSEAATRVSLIASGQSQQLDGEVCITASEALAVYILPPIIQAIQKAYPGINITVLADDKISDLGRREADIALRNIRPTQPDLIAKKVCDLTSRLYANPAYLESLGQSLTIDHLNKAHFIGFNRSQDMIAPLATLGLSLTPENFPVVSENYLVQVELIKLGAGIGMMIEPFGDNEPLVERVAQTPNCIRFPVWLVAHHHLKSSKRIRVVFDLLSEALSALDS